MVKCTNHSNYHSAKIEWHEGELFPRIGFIVTNLRWKHGNVVSHARYVTFQMAEVPVSKSMFYEILAKIHRLKLVPNGYD